ncbi:MAG: peptide chain release factor N(5)-glutamine methyltransferase [Desulfocapsaceae bacterium]|nr:peptide chain release factor N(5)-glutamine methyltransferase [Desulfocapsaceae bacterium]
MIIAQLLREGATKLKRAGISEPDLDCILLLGHCLKMGRTELFLRGNEPIDEQAEQLYYCYLERRAAREPVAYIVGYREFWSLDFMVNNKVLIPRPETEFLLETALKQIGEASLIISQGADLCCGSGVGAVVLARELKARILAVDFSTEALDVCQYNCKRHGVEDYVTLLCSDLFKGVDQRTVFSFIVANPPYVRSSEIRSNLEPEVTEFEPYLALDGGKDGLDCIRQIARQVINHLEPSGLFFMEFGADQAEEVHLLFSRVEQGGRFFQRVEILQDYSGRDRVLAAQLNQYKR